MWEDVILLQRWLRGSGEYGGWGCENVKRNFRGQGPELGVWGFGLLHEQLCYKRWTSISWIIVSIGLRKLSCIKLMLPSACSSPGCGFAKTWKLLRPVFTAAWAPDHVNMMCILCPSYFSVVSSATLQSVFVSLSHESYYCLGECLSHLKHFSDS